MKYGVSARGGTFSSCFTQAMRLMMRLYIILMPRCLCVCVRLGVTFTFIFIIRAKLVIKINL